MFSASLLVLLVLLIGQSVTNGQAETTTYHFDTPDPQSNENNPYAGQELVEEPTIYPEVAPLLYDDSEDFGIDDSFWYGPSQDKQEAQWLEVDSNSTLTQMWERFLDDPEPVKAQQVSTTTEPATSTESPTEDQISQETPKIEAQIDEDEPKSSEETTTEEAEAPVEENQTELVEEQPIDEEDQVETNSTGEIIESTPVPEVESETPAPPLPEVGGAGEATPAPEEGSSINWFFEQEAAPEDPQEEVTTTEAIPEIVEEEKNITAVETEVVTSAPVTEAPLEDKENPIDIGKENWFAEANEPTEEVTPEPTEGPYPERPFEYPENPDEWNSQVYPEGEEYDWNVFNEPDQSAFPQPEDIDNDPGSSWNEAEEWRDRNEEPPRYEFPKEEDMEEKFTPDPGEEGFDPPYRPRRDATPWLRRDMVLGEPREQACGLPKDSGDGPDETNSWYFDKYTGECKWFAYSGYGGNANRFYSREACEKLCIEENSDPCSGVVCPSNRMVCSGVTDEDCMLYNKDRPENCPPKQPVCVTRGGRGVRVAPKLRYELIPEICKQPKNPGNCHRQKRVSVVYYYDSEQKICQSLYFNECGGNDNRFRTKQECMNYCSP